MDFHQGLWVGSESADVEDPSRFRIKDIDLEE